jgi:hypothetical protein
MLIKEAIATTVSVAPFFINIRVSFLAVTFAWVACVMLSCEVAVLMSTFIPSNIIALASLIADESISVNVSVHGEVFVASGILEDVTSGG